MVIILFKREGSNCDVQLNRVRCDRQSAYLPGAVKKNRFLNSPLFTVPSSSTGKRL